MDEISYQNGQSFNHLLTYIQNPSKGYNILQCNIQEIIGLSLQNQGCQ